ncbi:MAG: zinc metallopeptidase [Gammaproteobacteria bacterium]|nr:zinc metallopeptidase [Gammaproteobacteria bacterium]
MALAIVGAIILIALLLVPQLWSNALMTRYGRERDDIKYSGSEFAQHLIREHNLDGVSVEPTSQGDHYDHITLTVRLSQANYNSRSLTAIAVAAHEVGHAIQHSERDSRFMLRDRVVRMAAATEHYGSFAFIAIPILALATRSPLLPAISFLIGFFSMTATTIAHLSTLPVEMDASFNRALPILKQGGYIKPADERAVHKILKAAAYTYVAASLTSLLNIWRWLKMMRR